MADMQPELNSLSALLDASSRPIYAVDARRRIVYCNPALASWLELQIKQIVGRIVEYHSEAAADKAGAAAPLADLCPPPLALAGQFCVGTVSSLARSGGLIHRQAQFLPLVMQDDTAENRERPSGGVFVLLADHNLSPHELSSRLSGDKSADELHRTIRQFRRAQTDRFAVETLLGVSSAMSKVRAQVAAAAASGANALISGRPGSGRGHVARAIHYSAVGETAAKLVPLDCELANDDLLRRALETVSQPGGDARHRPTLLLENVERLAESHQEQLVSAWRQHALAARIVATSQFTAGSNRPSLAEKGREIANEAGAGAIGLPLLDIVSTITIQVPPLADRIEDLPILAQYFLEAANRGNSKQLGSLQAHALDALALYSWPGELRELREVVAAAHRTCATHEITPPDLPAVVHNACKSAARVRRGPERIELDTLLAEIEREAVVRALAESGGNKTEAAELLGMTRPRLYRRLLQLGLAGPEFIEQENIEENETP
jgi:DNA-binding NtrC family response regulator